MIGWLFCSTVFDLNMHFIVSLQSYEEKYVYHSIYIAVEYIELRSSPSFGEELCSIWRFTSCSIYIVTKLT